MLRLSGFQMYRYKGMLCIYALRVMTYVVYYSIMLGRRTLNILNK